MNKKLKNNISKIINSLPDISEKGNPIQVNKIKPYIKKGFIMNKNKNKGENNEQKGY